MKYELSERASKDVDNIIEYSLEQFGKKVTNDYFDGLYYSFELLTDNPRFGRVTSGKTRQYIYRKHVISYYLEKDYIIIFKIIHSRINI